MLSPKIDGAPYLSPEAEQLVAGFTADIAALRAKKHAEGRSYSIMLLDGRVAHAHPDGTTRISRDPASEIIG